MLFYKSSIYFEILYIYFPKYIFSQIYQWMILILSIESQFPLITVQKQTNANPILNDEISLLSSEFWSNERVNKDGLERKFRPLKSVWSGRGHRANRSSRRGGYLVAALKDADCATTATALVLHEPSSA